MPIYEYGCDGCGDSFETTQNIKDNPLDTCTKCGGKLKRLISASAFHLKGTGWYKTDYASTEKKDGSGSTDKAVKSAKDENKKEPASDTKKTADASSTG